MKKIEAIIKPFKLEEVKDGLHEIEDRLSIQAERETCLVCGKSVEHGGSYCWIMYKEKMGHLCCHLCLETFTKDPEACFARQKTAEELGAIYGLLKSKSKHETQLTA